MEDIIVVKKPKLILKALLCEENKVVFGELMLNEQIFESANINLYWVAEESIFGIDAPNAKHAREVFVIPKFENNQIYDYLNSLGHFVWGTWVIEYCVQMEKPLPTNRRLCYSFAFDGLTVLLSGFDTESTKITSQLIEMMNGRVASPFNFNADILVAYDCESTYEYNLFCSKGKPICSVNAVLRLLNLKNTHISQFVNANRNDFKMSLFEKCVVTFSGIGIQQRNSLVKSLEQHGGIHSIDMYRCDCTHLVTNRTNDLKYQFAKTWGVKVVTVQWILDSLENNIRMPESKYHPGSSVTASDKNSN